jgi:hypothetical protein
MKQPESAPATIRRVDLREKQLTGFHVRAWHEGQRIQRFFSDRKFGGKSQALQIAQAFAAQLGEGSEFRNLLRRLMPRKNSRSGTPGVARYERAEGKRAYWLAYWDESGRKVNKKFSVSVYGEERARELAHKARQKATKEYRKRLAELRKQDARLLQGLKS